MRFYICIMSVLLWFAFTPSILFAQQGDRVRVVVEEFQGEKARYIRKYVIKALRKKDKVEIVSKKDMEETLSDLDVSLESEEDYHLISQELKINAFIDGEVIREENGWAVSVWVRQGDGKFIGQQEWRDRRFRRLSRIRKLFWTELGDAVLSAKVGQEDDFEEEQEEPLVSATQSVDEDMYEDVPVEKRRSDFSRRARDSKKSIAIEPVLSFGANWRNNEYAPDDEDQPFQYYNEFMSATPWLDINVEWYPGAHFTQEWPAHLGFIVGFGIGLGAKSIYEEPDSESEEEPEEPDTLSYQLLAGLIGRIPIEPLELGLTVSYGRRIFKTSGFEGLPDVAHSYIKMGLMADILIAGGFGMDAEAAYLLRIDSGELSSDDYFPELSGGGFELGIGAYYRITELLFIRADFSVQYFYFDVGENENYDELESGFDIYYTTTLGFGLRY